MSHYDLIALEIRETRSREAAKQASNIPTRLAHLKLADRYQYEITAINSHAIMASPHGHTLQSHSNGLELEQNEEEVADD